MSEYNFTATKFSTVEDKIKFAEQFKKFVLSDYSKKKFPKWFYTRLSMTFGHIAHYNQHVFYEHFFESRSGKAVFKETTMSWPCYGQADCTFCDVERYLQQWLRNNLQWEWR